MDAEQPKAWIKEGVRRFWKTRSTLHAVSGGESEYHRPRGPHAAFCSATDDCDQIVARCIPLLRRGNQAVLLVQVVQPFRRTTANLRRTRALALLQGLLRLGSSGP